jgi:glycosyltransferase involved in cell wall biosynthesis
MRSAVTTIGVDGRIGVVQICDTLEAGGLERMAVHIANLLPRDRFRSHLCATRAGGALEDELAGDVLRLEARRRSRFDVRAILRLAADLRAREIRVAHAHGTALFAAVAAAVLAPEVSVVWHDHFGRFGLEERPVWLYRAAAARTRGVVAVTRPLAEWSVRVLGRPPGEVGYLPNFVVPPRHPAPASGLPGRDGLRIVCLANIRPEKDHENVLRAMRRVADEVAGAHLLLVGGSKDDARAAELRRLAGTLRLDASVSWLGSRRDAPGILAASDVGILGSSSEGLPLSLLEYGAAGLASVATDVGECADVLAEGAGLVVPPRDPEALARAIVALLRTPEERARLGRVFQERFRRRFGPEAGIARIVGVYDRVMAVRDRPVAA